MWSLQSSENDPMLREAIKVAKSEMRKPNRTRVPYNDGSGNPPSLSPRYVKRKSTTELSSLSLRGSTKPLSRRESGSSRRSS